MRKKSSTDHALIRKIVKETAVETVHETLNGIGFDPKTPQEIQADLHYLRKIRKGSEFMSLRIKTSIIAVLIPTVLYLLWEAVKNLISR